MTSQTVDYEFETFFVCKFELYISNEGEKIKL